MSTARKPLEILPFYGYPARLIAQWCGVSLRTAKRYKAGHRVTLSALRLFTLMRDRRVLPEGWLYNDRTGELCHLDYALAVPLSQILADYVTREMKARPMRTAYPSFEPVLQRSLGSLSELAFESAFAPEPGKVTRA